MHGGCHKAKVYGGLKDSAMAKLLRNHALP